MLNSLKKFAQDHILVEKTDKVETTIIEVPEANSTLELGVEIPSEDQAYQFEQIVEWLEGELKINESTGARLKIEANKLTDIVEDPAKRIKAAVKLGGFTADATQLKLQLGNETQALNAQLTELVKAKAAETEKSFRDTILAEEAQAEDLKHRIDNLKQQLDGVLLALQDKNKQLDKLRYDRAWSKNCYEEAASTILKQISDTNNSIQEVL